MYFGDCNNIKNDEKNEIHKKYDPNNLFLKVYKYDKWYKNAEEKGKSQPEETKSERVKEDQKQMIKVYLTCRE